MPTQQDLRTAERIRDRILEAAGDAVERIVFYGSRATGRPHPSSDYDILVVVRDPVPDWTDASLRLSGLFDTFDRPVDVQVFGRTEFEESRPVAGTVAYPADRHGVLLYAKPGGSARSSGHQWIESARDDLAWAEMGASAPAVRGVAQIGFHAQQAIEKLLKALLTSYGVEPEDQHSLGRLVEQVRRLDRTTADASRTSRG